jgi:ribosomal protein S1
VSDKGVLLNVTDTVKAFLPSNESGVGKADFKNQFKAGDVIDAQIKKFDERERRLVVSVKMLNKRQEKESMRDFLKQQGDSSVTLGDMLNKSKAE